MKHLKVELTLKEIAFILALINYCQGSPWLRDTAPRLDAARLAKKLKAIRSANERR